MNIHTFYMRKNTRTTHCLEGSERARVNGWILSNIDSTEITPTHKNSNMFSYVANCSSRSISIFYVVKHVQNPSGHWVVTRNVEEQGTSNNFYKVFCYCKFLVPIVTSDSSIGMYIFPPVPFSISYYDMNKYSTYTNCAHSMCISRDKCVSKTPTLTCIFKRIDMGWQWFQSILCS